MGTFRVELCAQPECLRIALFGEFDLAGMEAVPAWDQIDGRPEVEADLSGLRFMDSTGLHWLLQLKEYVEKEGGRLSVRCPMNSPVMRLLEMTGMTDRFALVG
jgi:anti-anti-sigma factor